MSFNLLASIHSNPHLFSKWTDAMRKNALTELKQLFENEQTQPFDFTCDETRQYCECGQIVKTGLNACEKHAVLQMRVSLLGEMIEWGYDFDYFRDVIFGKRNPIILKSTKNYSVPYEFIIKIENQNTDNFCHICVQQSNHQIKLGCAHELCYNCFCKVTACPFCRCPIANSVVCAI
jgi:hypothetical protein